METWTFFIAWPNGDKEEIDAVGTSAMDAQDKAIAELNEMYESGWSIAGRVHRPVGSVY